SVFDGEPRIILLLARQTQTIIAVGGIVLDDLACPVTDEIVLVGLEAGKASFAADRTAGDSGFHPGRVGRGGEIAGAAVADGPVDRLGDQVVTGGSEMDVVPG